MGKGRGDYAPTEKLAATRAGQNAHGKREPKIDPRRLKGQGMRRTIERPLTPTEVADLFTVSVDTLKKWRVKGEGPDFYKIGRVVRYDPASVRKYMKINLIHLTRVNQ